MKIERGFPRFKRPVRRQVGGLFRVGARRSAQVPPGQPKKVQRGGSFLCSDEYCSRYILGTRGKGEISTGTNHLGFRCVMPASPDSKG